MADDWARWNYEKGITYAVEALKAALLLNGGAAVALLAFMGTYTSAAASKISVDVKLIASALPLFGWGAILAAVAFGIAYVAQYFFAARLEQGLSRRNPLFWLAEALQLLGIGAFGWSMWSFYTGVSAAGRAVGL